MYSKKVLRHKSLEIMKPILLFFFIIIMTRCLGLIYNINLHPDEPIFSQSSSSLLLSLIDPDTEFTEPKEYPEGTYLFHLPFQAFGRILTSALGTKPFISVWGRVASVFYFAMSVVIGMWILWSYMEHSKSSVILFGLTMTFSLFFIEHSRYGVGDMVSLFLLMLLIFLTAKAFSGTYRQRYLFFACAVAGIMGSVKYPLILFIFIPLSSFMFYKSPFSRKQKIWRILAFVLTSFVALLLFSPKAIFDWGYFVRVFQREANAYITAGTLFEAGGVANHIAATILYSLLYSDFPSAFVLLIFCFTFLFRSGRRLMRCASSEEKRCLLFLFHYAIPAMCVFFLIYNLFAKLLVFRTLTPYFGLSALYVSFFAKKIMEKSKWHKAVIVFLTAIMVIRGSALMCITSIPADQYDRFGEKVYAATDQNWTKSIVMKRYALSFDQNNLKNPEFLKNIEEFHQLYGESMEIPSGTLLVTGGYEFALGEQYILPSHTADANRINMWEKLVEANKDYYVDQSYPAIYYYLFGGWIRGGTLSTSLIPCNYIYYRP